MGDMCLTRVLGKGWFDGEGGKLLITAWDFIKPRLSCAQCIVYYLALLRGFGAGNTLVSSFPTSPSPPLPLSLILRIKTLISAARTTWPASFAKIERLQPSSPLLLVVVSNYRAWTLSKLGGMAVCLDRRQPAKLYPGTRFPGPW